ncbi:putative pentatricopeptide repeat-containing protein At3g49142 [Nymphaea colorata]|uniref:DYW domain-containing protein n=1 Tax=Nymphaea colorata TaxID=210225 RepID=A0A5K1G302_9MAGN|nr:putative pentatricopeptide repeat-containing protein At3g49142 [Nymphaea colorata]XP_031492324.1 putative pentatricopeptide repeat-containing protein At3g49142 [Nymphaea colorata]XP_031492325.1 putative pentatricopeptide repeat-containing protein At3g49142 [Nymphaea colorata]XP_031492326.1 putative pentatricopeptide repeat-containing protein At3g49142 [Nymphaea colorata]XP_031492328.1 putative pentatricopeptide repeat-containing protein At3g49142 [Nymphaea colorata]XP_031492331.1 putative p
MKSAINHRAYFLLRSFSATVVPQKLSTRSPVYRTDHAERCDQILDECSSRRAIEQTHSQIIVGHLAGDVSIAIKLVRAYARAGVIAYAHKVFDEVPEGNTVLCNVLIRGYCNNHLYADAVSVYLEMQNRGVSPDKYTFPCVFKASSGLGSLRLGLQLHVVLIKYGLDSNIFVGNALVAVYAKCNDLISARQMFVEMPRRDVVSWNSIIAGYAQNGCFDEALKLCKEMGMQKVKPDAGTMASILPALTHAKSDGIQLVREMFDRMTCKGLISWNAMIAVYVNNGMASDALELFSKMEDEGALPDAVTLATVLPACGDLSALEQGKHIHEYVLRNKIGPNLFLDNALVDMYAKCGSLSAAREVFDGMTGRDVVSWTAMISAYGTHGRGRDALDVFSEMLHSGIKPDQIAFVSVLSACSHAGLLNEGRYYFDCMTREYQITPLIEHYVCMVDLLGRAGKLDEAYDFIKQMPTGPNERVWGALLGACRVYSNITLGVVAADHLFRLVPEQAGYYVLLSNMYASAGRWQDVLAVRSLMKGRGIKKLPGFSSVELDDKVHSFFVGDTSHPQTLKIYAKLEELMGLMKEAGYVAEIDFALHDIEEEEKENHLSVHSEKLAIAFLLINTEPGSPIRVTKNLRVCGDCHRAAKFISKITDRKIILRDTNRFHHFEDGTCSCHDYW